MRKLTAFFVLLAFVFTLQLSVQPLAAESEIVPKSEQPSVVEQHAASSSSSGKKSILPIILGVVAAGAIVAVLVLVVFKTKYDITGTWDFAIRLTGSSYDEKYTFVLTGTKESGTVKYGGSDFGTYKVDGKDVTIVLNNGYWTGVGKFSSKNNMEGTWTNLASYSGTWTAKRASAGASSDNLQERMRESFIGK